MRLPPLRSALRRGGRFAPAAGHPSALALLAAALLADGLGGAATALPAAALAPESVVAEDRAGDGGGEIDVRWRESATGAGGDGSYTIERAAAGRDSFAAIGTVRRGVTEFIDSDAPVGRAFIYRVVFVSRELERAVSPPSLPAASRPNWFRPARTNVLVLLLGLTTLVLFFIGRARAGAHLFIRRIAGLNAIDEAIGRATEMGRKVLYVPGIGSMDEIQTIASLAILGYVAKQSATYGAELDVPNRDPLTYASARETVKHAYTEAGRPDLFREEIVNYVTYDQFAYTAVITGRMVRERPATNFFIGAFHAESLVLSETGQTTGAIQIAGTAEVFQLPFFVATCDYTLIGEELYAASAYLSRAPVLLGSIKGQDFTKAALLVIGIAGVILSSLGWPVVARLFTMR